MPEHPYSLLLANIQKQMVRAYEVTTSYQGSWVDLLELNIELWNVSGGLIAVEY